MTSSSGASGGPGDVVVVEQRRQHAAAILDSRARGRPRAPLRAAVRRRAARAGRRPLRRARTRSCSCSAGSALAFVPGMPDIELDAHVVLLVFIPPLLLSAGWYSSPRELRAESRALGLLALALVLVTMAAVAVAAHALVDGLSWPAAFMLGAVVAPTDAVAAVATFASVRVPERVRLLVQGESLINDATGLTAFRVALAAAGVEGVLAGPARSASSCWRRPAARSSASPSAGSILRAIRRQPDVTVSVLLTVLARLRELHRGRGGPRLRHPRRRRLRPLQRLAPVGVLRRRHAPDRQRVLEDHGLRAGGAAVRAARPAARVGRRRGRRGRGGPAARDRRGAGGARDRRAGRLRAAAARARAQPRASGWSSAGAGCAARSRSPRRSRSRPTSPAAPR